MPATHLLKPGTFHPASPKHKRPVHNASWDGKPYLACETMPLVMPVDEAVSLLMSHAQTIEASRLRPKDGKREYMIEFVALKYQPEFYSEQGLRHRVRQLLLNQCRGKRVRLNVLRSKKSSWEAIGVMQGFESPTKISLTKCTLAKPESDRVFLKDQTIVLKIAKVVGIALAA